MSKIGDVLDNKEAEVLAVPDELVVDLMRHTFTTVELTLMVNLSKSTAAKILGAFKVAYVLGQESVKCED